MEFKNIIWMMELIKYTAIKSDGYKLDEIKKEYQLLYKTVIHPFIYDEKDPDTLASEKEFMHNLSNEIFELVA